MRAKHGSMKKNIMGFAAFFILIFSAVAFLFKSPVCASLKKHLPWNKTPKISVVVPVYNTSAYLDKCLTSLTGQTLKDIEIICINDGSKDNSPEILKKYSKKDKRIKIINQENRGVSASRNAGIKEARGEYISFVDSDDFLDVYTYENCLKSLEEHKPDVFVMGDYKFSDGMEENLEADAWNASAVKVYGSGENVLGFPSPELEFNCDVVWNKIVKRSFVLEHELLFKEDVSRMEDCLYDWMAFFRAKKVVVDDNKMYFYRTMRQDSAMSTANSENMLKNALLVSRHLMDEYNKYNFLKGKEQWLLNLIVYIHYRHITRGITSKQEKKYYASKMMEVFDESFLEKVGVKSKEFKQLKKLAN